MAKKIIEKFTFNFDSVTNNDTDDVTSTRIDKSRYEDNTKTEGMYNINSGPVTKGIFKDISFRLRDDNLKNLSIPTLDELNQLPEKESIETPSLNKIPDKEGVDVENSSQISGRLEFDAKTIEENYKKPINYNKQSPDVSEFDNSEKLENEGRNSVPVNKIPEKEGVDTPQPNKIPEKQGTEISEINEIPNKIAIDNLNSYEPIEFDKVDNLSPELNNDKINPFTNSSSALDCSSGGDELLARAFA